MSNFIGEFPLAEDLTAFPNVPRLPLIEPSKQGGNIGTLSVPICGGARKHPRRFAGAATDMSVTEVLVR